MIAQHAREAASDEGVIIHEQHPNAELVLERITLSHAFLAAAKRRFLRTDLRILQLGGGRLRLRHHVGLRLRSRGRGVGASPERMTQSDPLEDKLRIRVLLVDDHALVRNGLSSVLRYHTELQIVGEAADGQEAVALAAALKPDVVVMDVNMPRMDGVEASKRIKRDLPGTVVIGLSMHEGGHHENAMRESGAAAYLTKDSAAERLIETILRCRAESLTGTRAFFSSSSLSE